MFSGHVPVLPCFGTFSDDTMNLTTGPVLKDFIKYVNSEIQKANWFPAIKISTNALKPIIYSLECTTNQLTLKFAMSFSSKALNYGYSTFYSLTRHCWTMVGYSTIYSLTWHWTMVRVPYLMILTWLRQSKESLSIESSFDLFGVLFGEHLNFKHLFTCCVQNCQNS